ncbi:MAG: hypothetical protein IKB08_08660 [Clostridia bacterium]|nr:hypothetical protein [Clostridia bacterium]
MRVKWCSIEKGEKEKHSIICKIIEMLRLYAKYGNYAEVGRQIGRSSSTVAKYVKMEGVPQIIRLAVQNLSQK